MLERIDLKTLTEIDTTLRAVTTMYIKSPRGMASYERRMKAVRKALLDHPEELGYFEANHAKISTYLKAHPYTSGGLYIVCCEALEVFESYTLDFIEERLPLEDSVWFDSSPYIRPIAELKDEFECYVVVRANNHSARVDVVTAGRHETDASLLGQIKNHVKKGGWSQQRYARRREKQLANYATEISEAIERIERRQSFSRILMLGSREILQTLEERLPRRLRNKVTSISTISDGMTNAELEGLAVELVQESEREQESELWEQIREEFMQQGRAVVGAMDVHVALQTGRVHVLLVQRDARIHGTRCKVCGNLALGERELCTQCGERNPFAVDMINEFVELAAQSGARVEFSDVQEELDSFEGVAALLRY